RGAPDRVPRPAARRVEDVAADRDRGRDLGVAAAAIAAPTAALAAARAARPGPAPGPPRVRAGPSGGPLAQRRRLCYRSGAPMSPKVFLSTHPEPLDPEHAKISVFDRGFLYGDSVYETMRTAGGWPLELRRHLRRLRRSGEGIGLRIPFSDEQLADAIARTHRASGNEESYVRLMVTRGAGPVALDPRHSEEPTLVVLVQPLVLADPAAYERGIPAVVVG